jgi:hypothetical protein
MFGGAVCAKAEENNTETLRSKGRIDLLIKNIVGTN